MPSLDVLTIVVPFPGEIWVAETASPEQWLSGHVRLPANGAQGRGAAVQPILPILPSSATDGIAGGLSVPAERRREGVSHRLINRERPKVDGERSFQRLVSRYGQNSPNDHKPPVLRG